MEDTTPTLQIMTGKSTSPSRWAQALLLSVVMLGLNGTVLHAQQPQQQTTEGAPRSYSGALRPGDMIEVRISGVPAEEVGQFTGAYTVDEQGMISLPYVGSIKSSGLVANQLQTLIENRLKSERIYTHPTITVMVHNAARFVNVRGAVKAPSRVPYTADLTLMTAINAAGGLTEFGGRRVRLIRDGKTREFLIKDIVRDPKLDIPVRPGDQIEALQSWW